jgi:hypothetical protein
VAASTFTLHNHLLSLGGEIPLLPILFMILAVACGIMLYQRLTAISSQSVKQAEQLEMLKRSIEQSKANEKEQESEKENEKESIIIDFENESKQLIPTETFENEEHFSENLLSNIAKKFEIVQGLVFLKNDKKGKFTFTGGYAFFSEEKPREFIEGETLSGQVAKNKVVLNLSNVPEEYITILSGLGKGSPKHLLIVPIINSQNVCTGIMELASFKVFGNNEVEIFRLLGLSLGDYFESSSQSSNE